MKAAPVTPASRPLLTIAIPTYNRVGFVEPLVRFLADEIAAGRLQDRVEVLVADNASPDGTAAALAPYADMGAVTLVTHAENRGAGANVRFCLSEARADLVWVLGDDDRPAAGLVERISDMLRVEKPDLIFLPPIWVQDARPRHASDHTEAVFRQVSPDYFARSAGVGLTFLSSFVVNAARVREHVDFDIPADKWLPQLEWVLPALDNGATFFACDRGVVIATSANGGGYPVLEVFASRLGEALGDRLMNRPELVDHVLADLQERFLPPLIWRLGSGKAGRFGRMDGDDLALLRAAYRDRTLLGGIVVMIPRVPRSVGWCLYASVAAWSKVRRVAALRPMGSANR